MRLPQKRRYFTVFSVKPRFNHGKIQLRSQCDMWLKMSIVKPKQCSLQQITWCIIMHNVTLIVLHHTLLSKCCEDWISNKLQQHYNPTATRHEQYNQYFSSDSTWRWLDKLSIWKNILEHLTVAKAFIKRHLRELDNIKSNFVKGIWCSLAGND